MPNYKSMDGGLSGGGKSGFLAKLDPDNSAATLNQDQLDMLVDPSRSKGFDTGVVDKRQTETPGSAPSQPLKQHHMTP